MVDKRQQVALLVPKYARGFVLESVPLNLSYLGAVLEKEGYGVRGFNLYFDSFSDKEIKEYRYFGITSTTSVFSEAVKLAKRIKKVNSESVVIIGGPHATACPGECLSIREIDYVVIGEGEKALPALIKSLERKLPIKDVPNLVYRQQGRLVKNRKDVIPDLDKIPFPAKHLFDTSRYPSKQKAYGDIIASRGCPFKCINCKPGLDNIAPYRLRHPEKVVDEMEWLMKDYGVRHFTFSDSELVGPKEWVKKFTKEIIKRNLKVTYSCNGRTDQVDKEVLSLLKKSGCIFIGYGVESGSQDVIDQILKKGIDLRRSKEVITETIESGIGVGGWFMVGIPGETEAQIKQTIDFAKELDLSIIEISISTPWPDTDYYNICKKNGWLLTEDWDKMNEKGFVAIETPYLGAKRVRELFDLFRDELKSNGWSVDMTGTRFYHRNFLWRTLRISLDSVLRRGIQKGDFVRLFSWLVRKY